MDNKQYDIKCEYSNIKNIVESLTIFKNRLTECTCLKYNYRRIIYKAFDTANNIYATVKFIIKHNIDDESLSLINFIKHNHHKNLAEVYELGVIGNFYVIFIKYIDGLKFNDFICMNNDSKVIKSVISGIIDGLYFLHSNHILHSDIKPSNIIVDLTNTAKIIDFDLLMQINDQFIVGNVIVGTYPYIPMEILVKKTYYLKSDIWGLGVSIIRSLFEWNNHNFPGTSKCNDECGDMEKSLNPFNYSDVDISFAIGYKIDNDMWDLIKKMVLNNISDRPSSSEVLQILKNQ